MRYIKLKYYLRGLGIGILVTALFLGITGNSEEALTDAQIRERALSLGMVDGNSVVLSELKNDIHETEVVPSEEEQSTEKQQPIEEQPSEEEPTEEETSEEQILSDEMPSAAPVTEAAKKVTFEICKGAGSDTVSRDLEAAGLIDDAATYDRYLCDNGYSRKLRIGIYELVVGMKEEEIAKIITGKQ